MNLETKEKIERFCLSDRPDEKNIPVFDYLDHARGIYDVIEPALQKEKPVLVISGPSGSGKSTLASLIAWVLLEQGRKPYVMSGDNYPHKIPLENDALRMKIYQESGRTGLEAYLGTEQEVSFEKVNRVIQDFHQKKNPVPMMRMGRTWDEVWEEKVDLSDRDVLIVEWTHGCSDALKGADVRVFLQVSEQTSLQRRIARGRDLNAADPFISMVLEIEGEKLDEARKRADYVFSEEGKLVKRHSI